MLCLILSAILVYLLHNITSATQPPPHPLYLLQKWYSGYKMNAHTQTNTMFAFLMLMMTTIANRRACSKEPHTTSIDRSTFMFTFRKRKSERERERHRPNLYYYIAHVCLCLSFKIQNRGEVHSIEMEMKTTLTSATKLHDCKF